MIPINPITRRAFAATGIVAVARALTPSRPVAASPRRQAAPLTGRVVLPGDPAYETARLTFNTRFARFPAGIVVCSSVEDVQNAVRWARQQGIPLCARSGGHGYEAFSTLDDALVIDVSGLSEVAVDAARGEAVVGAGMRLLDLYRRLWAYGVTVPGGTCPGVGIAGLTLGGGIGFLARQYGLTCDALVAVDLVDGNGDVLRASAEEHADLFWALRGGGGGNFGVAAAFTFRVHSVADVALFSVTWPWDDAAEVIDAWQRWAPFVDPRLTASLGIAATGASSFSAVGQFTGPAPELPSLLGPVLAAGSPGAPVIETVSYIAAAERFAGSPSSGVAFKNASAFVSEPLPAAAIAALVDGLRAAPTPANLVGLFPLGGAVAAVAPDATAFAHRDALFDLQYQAYWQHPSEEAADIAWVADLRAAMAPYTDGAYINYIDADQLDWEAAYYGTNLARLSRVKSRYDPDNVFNGPRSVPPGGVG